MTEPTEGNTMPNNPVEAATSLADCPDCASVVHTVNKHGGILAIEVAHSSTCPVWTHDRREVAVVLYGQSDRDAEVTP